MRLADLINIIKEAGKEKLKDNKNIAEDEVEEISSKVGLAALKYGDLSNQVQRIISSILIDLLHLKEILGHISFIQ